ncbi:hypothetical protein [Methanobrevibacter olleyae]|uniref:Uncharacterized protein n=1 Tax=Methanobrevibacter olleyae TaxID=294671 RepID=A0A126R2J0_METOL|nr:hypothetical protein [Methanobrevibacter olleyae]AMK16287.1 hypothetical protein YLM1_1732 [Methanobrevibacter olleyae]
MSSEIRHINFQELCNEPEIPYVDEDQHLHDFDHDYVVYLAEEHYSTEEEEMLFSIGLKREELP